MEIFESLLGLVQQHFEIFLVAETRKKARNLVYTFIVGTSEAYSEPSQKSTMKFSAEIVNGSKQLTIFTENPVLDVWLDSQYASEHICTKFFVWWNHNLQF